MDRACGMPVPRLSYGGAIRDTLAVGALVVAAAIALLAAMLTLGPFGMPPNPAEVRVLPKPPRRQRRPRNGQSCRSVRLPLRRPSLTAGHPARHLQRLAMT